MKHFSTPFASISILASSILPFLTSALVDFQWEIPSMAPTLNDITFSFEFPNLAPRPGYVFIQEVEFQGDLHFAHIGLKAQPNTNGQGTFLQAVFNSFVDQSTTSSSTCHQTGMTDGSVISCVIDLTTVDVGYPIDLKIENIGRTTWQGMMVDRIKGTSVVIGEWTLPVGSGQLAIANQKGFIEYTPFKTGVVNCGALPLMNVIIHSPSTTTTVPESIGSIVQPFQIGKCVNNMAFNSAPLLNGGYDITIGF